MAAVARALFLVALPIVAAQPTAVTLYAHLETNGAVSIRGSSRNGPLPAPLLSAVLNCPGRTSENQFDEIRCKHGLRRDRLTLETALDLAPIARTLMPADEIELWLDYPHLGFAEISVPTSGEGASSRVVKIARFAAGAVPGPIRIQFGYRPDQWAFPYLPLAGLVLAFTLLSYALSRTVYADLNRSVFLLGTIFWLGASVQLHAPEPLRILLSGTPLANIAAALAEYFPPMLCIAAGAAFGTRKTDGRTTCRIFAEVFWSFGMVLFPLTAALTAVTSMTDGAWLDALPWIAAAPLSILVCRWRIRANGAVTVRQLGSGELKDRIAALAAKAGRSNVRIYISTSTRSKMFNAFAMMRSGILFTAPLLQTLTRREVDAVAAHELSHFGHVRRSPWSGLAIAAVLFQTHLADAFLDWPGGMLLAVLIPVTVFFATLRGARKREFLADAGSAALTGDPRAMISALARISRHNERPLAINPVAEWFSSHPSTEKRIRALAAGLDQAELETLRNTDDPAAGYPLPPEDAATVFSLAWQNANGARYSWTVLLTASVSGLFIAGLLEKIGPGFPQFVGGLVLGCAITKLVGTAVMAANYARLGRKLGAKLGDAGQLVGLAIDSEPRIYNGYRFSDAGFLSFEGGRLCYRSERTTILLNPSDVVEITMVAAAPSTWRRLQPMIRFHDHAIILHPVEWAASPRRLFQSIEKWKATATSAETTVISGLTPVPGQAFHAPTIAQTARGFRIPGAVTLIGATLAGWFFRSESWPAWYALVVTACAYIYMFLPAMLYRPSTLPPALTPRIDAD